MNTLKIVSTLVIAFFFSASAFAGLLDKKVELSTLPPAVQQTINQNAQGGHVESIEEKLLKEDGLKVYEVEVKKTDGSEIEFEVDANGKLIDLEKD